MKFAFISRHQPTQAQYELAQAQGIELVVVGDADGFSVTKEWVEEKGDFDGVIVVHVGAALRLAPYFLVGGYENANRAPEGEKTTFEAVALHVFDLRKTMATKIHGLDDGDQKVVEVEGIEDAFFCKNA